MGNLINKSLGQIAIFACFVCLLPLTAQAVNTITFNPADAGVDKSVATWGVDVAQANADEVRQSIHHIGPNNVEIARVLVYFDEPLVNNGGTWELNAAAKAKVDNHLNVTTQVGTNPTLTLGTSGYFAGQIDSSYLQGGGINVTQYARAIKATQEYINTQSGFTGSSFYAIEAFNEPDYLIDDVYANPTDLNNVFAQLKGYTEFQNTYMMASSVLNSDEAQYWYDNVPQGTAGSSHLLAGSFTSFTNFIEHVNNTGKPFMNPEIHSMGEILAGADRGMEMGMVWGAVKRGRGTLIQATDGDRLAYGESLGTNSAGAVYRAPDGNIYAFAGGVERDYMGAPNAFRFVSTDPNTHFNGIPVQEYYIHTKNDEYPSASDNDFVNYGSASSEGAFATIATNPTDALPALDGYRWKIKSALTGQVMEVVSSGTNNGDLIRSAGDTGGDNQLWNIRRTRNGYFEFYNENSDLTAEVAGLTLNNNASVRQWGTADDSSAQWYIEPVGDGSYYIRNGHSNTYLTSNSTNSYQYQFTGSPLQKWDFVLANPSDGPKAHYTLAGNVSDSSGGANHGTPFGVPNYTTGPFGTPGSAIDLDGLNDYVDLPDNVPNSEDITIATWVKWDGGAAWQRIFDFGFDTNSYMFLSPSSDENRMRFAITTGGSANAQQIIDTDPLPVGEWVHVALTLGGNSGILYVDGVPQSAGQIIFDPTDITFTKSWIGRSQWTHDPYFNGAIADFQVFDYALDMDQIADLATIPFAPEDLNMDGFVDGLDLGILLGQWGQSTTPDMGELDGTPPVDGLDLGILLAAWNPPPIAATAAVPEPTTLTILITSCVLFLQRRV